MENNNTHVDVVADVGIVQESQARRLAKQHIAKVYHNVLGNVHSNTSTQSTTLDILPQQRHPISKPTMAGEKANVQAAILVHDRLLRAEDEASMSTATRVRAKVINQDKHAAITSYLRDHIENDHRGGASGGLAEFLENDTSFPPTPLPHHAQMELYAQRIAREEQRLASLRTTRKQTALRYEDTLADNHRVRCSAEVTGPVVAAPERDISGADSGDSQGYQTQIYAATSSRYDGRNADDLETALQREMAALREDKARLRSYQPYATRASSTPSGARCAPHALSPGTRASTPVRVTECSADSAEDVNARLEQELALLQEDRSRKILTSS